MNQRLRLHLHEVAVLIGTARLAPPSLMDELFRSEEDEDTSGTADADSKPRQAAAPATLTATMATIPSPSKSKFSFLRGGGGDLLMSPPSGSTRRTTPSTPTSSSRYDRRRGRDVRIAVVPLDSLLLYALRRICLSPHTSELILATYADGNYGNHPLPVQIKILLPAGGWRRPTHVPPLRLNEEDHPLHTYVIVAL